MIRLKFRDMTSLQSFLKFKIRYERDPINSLYRLYDSRDFLNIWDKEYVNIIFLCSDGNYHYTSSEFCIEHLRRKSKLTFKSLKFNQRFNARQS